jgi:hypothetical protein
MAFRRRKKENGKHNKTGNYSWEIKGRKRKDTRKMEDTFAET